MQQEIIKLTEKEYKQHEENKKNKIKDEVDNLMLNQKREYDIMTHKYLTKYSELKKERAIKFDELIQKYKNKHKDLNNNQTLEMTNFKKPGKKHFIKGKGDGMNHLGSSFYIQNDKKSLQVEEEEEESESEVKSKTKKVEEKKIPVATKKKEESDSEEEESEEESDEDEESEEESEN